MIPNNPIRKNINWAIWGGVISTCVTLFGAWLIGHLSGYEARILLKTALPGTNMLCNTVILASATILALLLTLLGISSNASSKLRPEHYKRVKQIALFDTALFVFSMIVFLLLNIPMTQSDKVHYDWYVTIYYSSLTASSLLGGTLISVVLMLCTTVIDIINIVGLNLKNHPMIFTEEEQDGVKTDEELQKTPRDNSYL